MVMPMGLAHLVYEKINGQKYSFDLGVWPCKDFRPLGQLGLEGIAQAGDT
jgi:hypothetical protein